MNPGRNCQHSHNWSHSKLRRYWYCHVKYGEATLPLQTPIALSEMYNAGLKNDAA
jgi:hypothetical protein